MAIKKNETIWGIENATVLEFGNADVLVLDAKGENYSAVMFKNIQGEYINQEYSEFKGKGADEVKPDVIMIFPSADSIDVVIEKLQLAKKELIELQSIPA